MAQHRLSERDMTRLSYLVDALVASPLSATRLVEIIRNGTPDKDEDPSFTATVNRLETIFVDRFSTVAPDLNQTLDQIVHDLIHQKDKPNEDNGCARLAGGFLSRALRMVRT